MRISDGNNSLTIIKNQIKAIEKSESKILVIARIIFLSSCCATNQKILIQYLCNIRDYEVRQE